MTISLGRLLRNFGGTVSGGGGTPPASPEIAVSDNANNTGAVVTISGSTVGSTNTVYRAAYNGDMGTLTWTSSGSRSGDGTVAVSCTHGYFWWYVLSSTAGGTAISNLVNQNVTDGQLAILTQIVAAVVARMKLVSLAGIGDKVYELKSQKHIVPAHSCCLVFRDPVVPITQDDATNIREDIGYPVQIAMIAPDPLTDNSPIQIYDLWRQQAERAFRNQRLPGVAGVIWTRVEPAMVLDPVPAFYARVITAFTVRVTSREPHGLGA
jgi:hypothetical protein